MNNTLGFFHSLFTSPGLSRLRVFLLWSLICSVPTAYVILVTLQYQVYIPGVEVPGTSQYFFSMLGGSSIVPVLFTLTNGLRGYHSLFSRTAGLLGTLFVPKPIEELETEFGPLLPEKVMRMEASATVLGFLTLEGIIIGWDVLIYILFNRMSGLSLFGFMSDNLMIGAFIFILEASNVVREGALSFFQLHDLKLKRNTNNKEEES